jgi:hypothetical protein
LGKPLARAIPLNIYVHDVSPVSALVIGAPGSEWILLPKRATAFWEGTQEIFGGVSEDLLGGAGKAEDAKLPGAGIIPKLCPMERAETGIMYGNVSNRIRGNRSHRED